MIEVQTAKIYYAPIRGRRYFSKFAAIHAETTAIILKKYPIEHFESDTGACYDIRFDDEERYAKMYRRLKRLMTTMEQRE